jgi:chromate transporter
MLELLSQLVAVLAPLSLVAIGGGFTVIPEIHRQVVDVHGWLTAREFADLFALARALPGPNIFMVSLIGYQVAGWPGAAVSILALVGPSSLLTFVLAQSWERLGRARWRAAVTAGLAPLAIGLVLASCFILAQAADSTPAAYLATALTVLLMLTTRLHPLVLMAAAAGLALAGWI